MQDCMSLPEPRNATTGRPEKFNIAESQDKDIKIAICSRTINVDINKLINEIYEKVKQ